MKNLDRNVPGGSIMDIHETLRVPGHCQLRGCSVHKRNGHWMETGGGEEIS